ncbi:MAG: hypothetical protein GEU81_17590 [Nitriliruptorales bacterium]|nr:hypothetical protein [Nitriliruptorales bacterium]
MTPTANAWLLAHPLLESAALPVPPVVVATVAALIVVAVIRWPIGSRELIPHAVARDGLHGWRPAWAVSRLAVVGVLAVALVAGRVGADGATQNLAPVLVVGVGWPLLVAGCVVVGGLWAWLDPWDTLARPFDRSQPEERSPESPTVVDVAPAAVGAFGWVWFLGAYGATFSPRAVGAAMALYTLGTLAGCLLLGRIAWLERYEAFGLLATWCGLLPRRRLTGWHPPPGAPVVLGVLAGGLLFSALRLSGVWFRLTHVAVATVAIAAACLAGIALLHGAERLAARRGAPGVVVAAAVPAVVSIVLAVAFTNDRLWLAAQILPAVLDDPLGRGWNLFGGVEAVVREHPLGSTGRVIMQIAILTAGHVIGALVARRRAGRAAVGPAMAALTVPLATGILAVSAV